MPNRFTPGDRTSRKSCRWSIRLTVAGYRSYCRYRNCRAKPTIADARNPAEAYAGFPEAMARTRSAGSAVVLARTAATMIAAPALLGLSRAMNT